MIEIMCILLFTIIASLLFLSVVAENLLHIVRLEKINKKISMYVKKQNFLLFEDFEKKTFLTQTPIKSSVFPSKYKTLIEEQKKESP